MTRLSSATDNADHTVMKLRKLAVRKNRTAKLPKIRKHVGTFLMVIVTLAGAGAVGWYVVRPAYMHPSNRTYTSGLGYPAVLRMRGQAFPVTTAKVTERPIKRQFLGEGLVESEPVRVPIVPEGRVAKVYVEEGDYVTRGQVLAELDPEIQENKISQSQAAIKLAEVQLGRARAGSVYGMEMERPEISASQLELAKKQVAIKNSLVEIYRKLAVKNIVSNEDMLRQELDANLATANLRAAEENIKISAAGRPLSVRAAELALEDAQLKYKSYTRELNDFKIRALNDGTVAQVLIHEGEYNRNPGTSAFVLAVGKWFGGNFDQTTLGRFTEGMTVNVRLEAYPGKTFSGQIHKIKPMVTYNPGGPEAARPIRPLGTGAPEWPATYTTRIQLVQNETLRDIVPGLTGFAEVNVERRGIAVPQGSVTSVSAGKGIAYVVEGNSFRAQPVVIGEQSEEWIEVVSGLSPGTEIITEGYQILQRGDRIVATPAKVAEPLSSKETRPQVGTLETHQEPNQVAKSASR